MRALRPTLSLCFEGEIAEHITRKNPRLNLLEQPLPQQRSTDTLHALPAYHLQAPDTVTRELLKFVTLRCVDPLQDNPMTQRRRSAAQWARRQKLVIAGTIALTTVVGIVVVAADVGGVRARIRDAVQSLRGKSAVAGSR